MKALKYAAAAAAATVLWAGAAQAAPFSYDGLAFNSSQDDFKFSAVAHCSPGFLGFGCLFGNLELLSGPNMDQAAAIAAGVGQAVYDVNGVSHIADDGTMVGGTIDFQPSTKAITFDAFEDVTMWITGGSLNILANDGPNTTEPEVDLPFGLGTADPDYELSGALTAIVNGASITLNLCTQASAYDCETDTDTNRPWNEEFGPQPYNTLNVGDDGPGGSTDLAMFMYMAGVTQNTYYWDGELVDSCQTWKSSCTKVKGGDIYWIKLALWGEGEPTDEVPEPATLSLFGLGLLGLGAAARRRRKVA